MLKTTLAAVAALMFLHTPANAQIDDGDLMSNLLSESSELREISADFGKCLPECERTEFSERQATALSTAWPKVFDQMSGNFGTCLTAARQRLGDEQMRNDWVPPIFMLRVIDNVDGNHGWWFVDQQKLCSS